jgi:aspartyl protease family protein
MVTVRLLYGALAALLLTAVPAAAVHAAGPIEAVGLFKDRAMLRVHGVEHYVRSGESTPEGARLVSATAELAIVAYQGQTYRLSLSDAVGGTFAELRNASISIAPDDHGQYRVGGAINGRPVDFLVDTGASVIAMSEQQARSLGIEYANSPDRAQVTTAQGKASSYLVSLDEVVVGGIATHNVRAAVIPGAYPVEVLLGMSFLRMVSMEESAGVLRLTQKY